MQKGDTVKYREPANEYEQKARFIVLDDPAKQIEAAKQTQKTHHAYRATVDMQEVCDLRFKPIRRACIDEIEVA